MIIVKNIVFTKTNKKYFNRKIYHDEKQNSKQLYFYSLTIMPKNLKKFTFKYFKIINTFKKYTEIQNHTLRI